MNDSRLDARFSYDNLLAAGDGLLRLLDELDAELTRRLREAEDPADEGYLIIEELRKLGHDLWSVDESDDFQIWCGDYVAPKTDYNLIVEIQYSERGLPFASAVFQPRNRG